MPTNYSHEISYIIAILTLGNIYRVLCGVRDTNAVWHQYYFINTTTRELINNNVDILCSIVITKAKSSV